MEIASKEAVKALGMTWTNPLVGAVIVKNGQVLASGYHHQFGQEHAEVNALNQLDDIKQAQGATLYVTLEPCSHYGKQPPCCQKVAEAGIKEVIIGQIDPHGIVAGKGIKYLNEHGVKTKVLGGTEKLNEAYNFFYQHHRPLVTLKYAMSLDGKLNGAEKARTLLTGPKAQYDVQKLRLHQQAILIGANTLRIDNPQLTVRIQALPQPPIRIILTHDVNQLDLTQNLFKLPGPIWLLSQTELKGKARANVHCFVSHKWTPQKIGELLAEREIQSLLVEGGSNLLAEFLAAGLADQIVAYIAPIVLGGTALPVAVGAALTQKLEYQLIAVQELGQDIRITARRK